MLGDTKDVLAIENNERLRANGCLLVVSFLLSVLLAFSSKAIKLYLLVVTQGTRLRRK